MKQSQLRIDSKCDSLFASLSNMNTRVQNSGRLSAIAGSFTTLAGKVSLKKFWLGIKLASRKNRKWFEESDNWNQRYYRKFKHFKGFLKNILKWVARIENSLENWSVLKKRWLYLQATGMSLLRVCSSMKHARFYEQKTLHKLPP